MPSLARMAMKRDVRRNAYFHARSGTVRTGSRAPAECSFVGENRLALRRGVGEGLAGRNGHVEVLGSRDHVAHRADDAVDLARDHLYARAAGVRRFGNLIAPGPITSR